MSRCLAVNLLVGLLGGCPGDLAREALAIDDWPRRNLGSERFGFYILGFSFALGLQLTMLSKVCMVKPNCPPSSRAIDFLVALLPWLWELADHCPVTECPQQHRNSQNPNPPLAHPGSSSLTPPLPLQTRLLGRPTR